MSRGRKLVPEIAFSTAGMSTRNLTLRPRDMIMCASASAVAAPPMSFFMLSMPVSVLMSSPPVSKHTPLPTRVTSDRSALPQVKSISRGARAEPPPTAWISGNSFGQRVAACDVEFGAVLCGELARGLFQFVRPHVVRRRVDEIAAKRHALDDAAEVLAVDAVRHHQPHIARLAPCGSG